VLRSNLATRSARSGFTLIELIVVLAIIATLAALVGPELMRNTGDARRQAAAAQIELFAVALDAYRLDTGTYPSTREGLGALRSIPAAGAVPRNWRGPYVRRVIPDDPWGRPYVYVSPGVVNPHGYDLYSLGRDGATGGTEEDQDITSWGGEVIR